MPGIDASTAGASKPNSDACHDTASANTRSMVPQRPDGRQVACQNAGVPVVEVTHAGDERLVPYTRLTDADHRRRWDLGHGSFVVEGVTAIRRALRSPYPVDSVLVTAAKAR